VDLLSPGWNLSRPVLLDKLFPREPGYTKLWQQTLKENSLSPRMRDAGICKVLPAFVMMWTPLCVMSLQRTSRTALSHPESAREFLQTEVRNLQLMRQQHQALKKSGTPVLLVNYADLLFREHYTLERMNAYLPCAGGNINAEFVPQMGVDIFPENKWKVRGTVHDFSSQLDPSVCCGYDPEATKCTNRTLYKLIPEFEEDLNDLETYFRRFST